MTAEPLRGPRLSEGVDLSVNQIPWEVKAVILFGSQARGDDDSASDTDLVAFADVLSAEALAQTHESLRLTWEVEGPEVTLYSTMTAVEMAGKGSLFLWHLRLEGRVLLERGGWWTELLSSLRQYGPKQATKDLETLRTILTDVEASLRRDNLTELFEAATLFTVLRNAAIITSFRYGTPLFGRREPINWLGRKMGEDFPYSQSDLDLLEMCRLAYNDKATLRSMPSRAQIETLAACGFRVLRYCGKLVADGL